ncbi:hypothetical protein D3C81_2144560 [compost metagenome]
MTLNWNADQIPHSVSATGSTIMMIKIMLMADCGWAFCPETNPDICRATPTRKIDRACDALRSRLIKPAKIPSRRRQVRISSTSATKV